MSTNELNIFLNSFDKPQHYSDAAWNEVINQSKKVWEYYLSGVDWNAQLEITCRESYLMLVNREGKLIIKNDSLLNYVKNHHVNSWRQQLEEVAFKAIRDKKYDIAERYFGKTLKLDATNAMNFYRRAIVRLKMMNQRGALQDLCEAIRLKPEVDSFYFKRAEIYRLLDVDHKAMSDLNKAIQLNPSNVAALEMRGKFRLSLGDKAGGKMDVQKAEALAQRGFNSGNEFYGAKAA